MKKFFRAFSIAGGVLAALVAPMVQAHALAPWLSLSASPDGAIRKGDAYNKAASQAYANYACNIVPGDRSNRRCHIIATVYSGCIASAAYKNPKSKEWEYYARTGTTAEQARIRARDAIRSTSIDLGYWRREIHVLCTNNFSRDYFRQ